MKATFGTSIFGNLILQLSCSVLVICFAMTALYVVMTDGAAFSNLSENFAVLNDLTTNLDS